MSSTATPLDYVQAPTAGLLPELSPLHVLQPTMLSMASQKPIPPAMEAALTPPTEGDAPAWPSAHAASEEVQDHAAQQKLETTDDEGMQLITPLSPPDAIAAPVDEAEGHAWLDDIVALICKSSKVSYRNGEN